MPMTADVTNPVKGRSNLESTVWQQRVTRANQKV